MRPRYLIQTVRYRGAQTAPPMEVAMQTFELVIFIVIGMALIAGLSFALYRVLPASMLERATGYGRYSGLGTPDDLQGRTAGNAAVTGLDALSGRSA
jgi:hypothetical protein